MENAETELTGYDKLNIVRKYEATCNGTGQYYRHMLGLIYTDGMRLVAETCGAYWLLDLVASHQPDIRRKHKALGRFQCWQLKPTPTTDEPNCWTITAWSDRPDASSVLARQRIPYSDFPEELAPFEFVVVFDGENTIAALRAED